MAIKIGDLIYNITGDSTQLNNQLGKAEKKVSGFGSVIKGLVAPIAGLFAVQKIFEFGKAIVNASIKFEQLNIAFKTFLGSGEKATKLLAELEDFSIVTPFTLDQTNQAAKTLLAFGVAGEEIIPTLKLIGDVSAGTGKDLSEMAVIFGQIKSTGRLMGQDLLQLINAGFNPLQVISEKTGRSMKDLKSDMEKGLISFEMVEGAFKSATSEGGLFFDLMNKQSQTLGGVISTLAGNFEVFARGLGDKLAPAIKNIVNELNDLITGTKESEIANRDINEAISNQVRSEIELQKIRKDKKSIVGDIRNAELNLEQAIIDVSIAVGDLNQKQIDLRESIEKSNEHIGDNAKELKLAKTSYELFKTAVKNADAELLGFVLTGKFNAKEGNRVLQDKQELLFAEKAVISEIQELEEPQIEKKKLEIELKKIEIIAQRDLNKEIKAGVDLLNKQETPKQKKKVSSLDILTNELDSRRSLEVEKQDEIFTLLENARKEANQDELDLTKEQKKQLQKIEDDATKTRVDSIVQSGVKFAEIAQNITNGVANIFKQDFENQNTILENELKTFEDTKKEEQVVLNKQLEQGLITKAQFEDKIQLLENQTFNKQEEIRKKQNELRKKQFETEKAFAIVNSIINTYLGASKAFVSSSTWQEGLVAAAIVTALGIAQTAVIASQPMPQFAQGTANVPSDMTAQIHRGEAIIPRTFAEDLRDGNIAITGGRNGNNGFSGGDVIVKVYTMSGEELDTIVRERTKSGTMVINSRALVK